MIKKKITAALMSGILVLTLTGCGIFNKDDQKENKKNKTEQSSVIYEDEDVADKVDEINTLVDAYFYFETDEEKQEEAIYDGIMAGLDDPYSVYYTEEEYADLMETNSGEYVGIGAVVTQDVDMVISVVRPIPGGPAEEAGIMAGDCIVEVDGEDVSGQELSLVVEKLRGVEGTTAHVKVYRPSVSDYMEFDIGRRVVENVSVYYETIAGDIGYVQVQQFYENTAEEFIEAIEALQAQNVKGVVVDLRDNPGGLLNAVVDMCDYLMDGGVIVTTKDKHGNVLSQYNASKGTDFDLPMVVLINGNSASASEIFAGAVKDTGIATLVGTTSYGKGIVQSVIPLSDGTAIKITIAKYFTPNGNDIHEIGIEPDYEVELPEGIYTSVNIDRKDDTQLEKAIEILRESNK